MDFISFFMLISILPLPGILQIQEYFKMFVENEIKIWIILVLIFKNPCMHGNFQKILKNIHYAKAKHRFTFYSEPKKFTYFKFYLFERPRGRVEKEKKLSCASLFCKLQQRLELGQVESEARSSIQISPRGGMDPSTWICALLGTLAGSWVQSRAAEI